MLLSLRVFGVNAPFRIKFDINPYLIFEFNSFSIEDHPHRQVECVSEVLGNQGVSTPLALSLKRHGQFRKAGRPVQRDMVCERDSNVQLRLKGAESS